MKKTSFSMRDCEVRVRGRETVGFEIMRSREERGEGESKEQKGMGLRITPLAALHYACDVIWCM